MKILFNKTPCEQKLNINDQIPKGSSKTKKIPRRGPKYICIPSLLAAWDCLGSHSHWYSNCIDGLSKLGFVYTELDAFVNHSNNGSIKDFEWGVWSFIVYVIAIPVSEQTAGSRPKPYLVTEIYSVERVSCDLGEEPALKYVDGVK